MSKLTKFLKSPALFFKDAVRKQTQMKTTGLKDLKSGNRGVNSTTGPKPSTVTPVANIKPISTTKPPAPAKPSTQVDTVSATNSSNNMLATKKPASVPLPVHALELNIDRLFDQTIVSISQIAPIPPNSIVLVAESMGNKIKSQLCEWLEINIRSLPGPTAKISLNYSDQILAVKSDSEVLKSDFDWNRSGLQRASLIVLFDPNNRIDEVLRGYSGGKIVVVLSEPPGPNSPIRREPWNVDVVLCPAQSEWLLHDVNIKRFIVYESEPALAGALTQLKAEGVIAESSRWISLVGKFNDNLPSKYDAALVLKRPLLIKQKRSSRSKQKPPLTFHDIIADMENAIHSFAVKDHIERRYRMLTSCPERLIAVMLQDGWRIHVEHSSD